MPEIRSTPPSLQANRSRDLERAGAAAPASQLDSLRAPTLDASDLKAAERLADKGGLSELTLSMIRGEVPTGQTLGRLRGDAAALDRIAAPPANPSAQRAWLAATTEALQRGRDASARLGNAVFFGGAEHLKGDAAAAERSVRAFEKRFSDVQRAAGANAPVREASSEVPWFMRPLDGLARVGRDVNRALGGVP